MFENLDVFRMAQGMATHASRRQTLIAQNIANADTPGYRAVDLRSFADHWSGKGVTAGLDHARPIERPGLRSPNGNTVSLETEMIASAEVQRDHTRALAIYRSALTILRAFSSAR